MFGIKRGEANRTAGVSPLRPLVQQCYTGSCVTVGGATQEKTQEFWDILLHSCLCSGGNNRINATRHDEKAR